MNRRTILKGGLVIAATAHTAVAVADVKADPLLDLIKSYHAGIKAYADHPHFGNIEAENAFCQQAFQWAIDEITAWDGPALSAECAVEALKLAKKEASDYDGSAMILPLVSAALGYLEENAA